MKYYDTKDDESEFIRETVDEESSSGASNSIDVHNLSRFNPYL